MAKEIVVDLENGLELVIHGDYSECLDEPRTLVSIARFGNKTHAAKVVVRKRRGR